MKTLLLNLSISYTMRKIQFTILLLIIPLLFNAQNDLLQSGPMLGYSDFREVLIWVQTKAAADVHIQYWGKDNQKKRTSISRTNADQ
ncbi:MAG: hypothetical protein AAGK97_08910, partial [Bacteroidota bacterium]